MKNTHFPMNNDLRIPLPSLPIVSGRMPLKILFFAIAVLGVVNAWGQNVDDYRSAMSGEWSTLTTWERWNGSSWATPANTPTSNDGEITILSPHVVTVTANVTVDQVTIEAGAQVTVNSDITWRIKEILGSTSLTVDGTINNSGTINTRGTPEEIINGMIINRGVYTLTAGSTLTFNANSTYQHARNGGVIPTATWDVEANCEITDIEDNNPGGLGQTFGNFKWECTGMTSNVNIGDAAFVIAGNFDIISTAGFRLRLNQDELNIGGNFTQMGGIFRMANATSRTLNIGGNFTQGGGTLRLSNNGGTGTINVGGNFTQTGGTINENSTGSGAINFTGSGTCTSSGTISNTVNFTINAGATVSFGDTNFGNSDGTFTNNGTLKGTGPLTIPTGGALQNDGTIAPGNSIGLLEIIGDFTNNGIVEIEVAGTPVANDVLSISGTATLGGTLNVIKTGGAINMGNAFTILTWGSLSGSFATVNLPGGSMSWAAPAYGLSDLIIEYINPAPLAIDLTTFIGKRVNKTIELNWTTATEQNNDFMAVERSADGVRFTEIGRVDGAGTTQEMQHYSFIDTAPLTGTNYYRLRQVDLDGQMEYHKVISVDFVNNKPTGNTIRLFPNPASEQLQVTWDNGLENTTLQIIDASGQLMAAYTSSGEQTTLEMPLQQLPAGVYFLKFIQGDQVETRKFLKQ